MPYAHRRPRPYPTNTHRQSVQGCKRSSGTLVSTLSARTLDVRATPSHGTVVERTRNWGLLQSMDGFYADVSAHFSTPEDQTLAGCHR
jgi:hypothetical protein